MGKKSCKEMGDIKKNQKETLEINKNKIVKNENSMDGLNSRME